MRSSQFYEIFQLLPTLLIWKRNKFIIMSKFFQDGLCKFEQQIHCAQETDCSNLKRK